MSNKKWVKLLGEKQSSHIRPIYLSPQAYEHVPLNPKPAISGSYIDILHDKNTKSCGVAYG